MAGEQDPLPSAPWEAPGLSGLYLVGEGERPAVKRLSSSAAASNDLLGQPGLESEMERRFLAYTVALTSRLAQDDRPAVQASHGQLLEHLYQLGAGSYLDGLLEGGQVDAAAQLITGFHAYVTHLLTLAGANGARSFRDMFALPEVELDRLPLETGHGKLLISGTIVGLRKDGTGQLELAHTRLWSGDSEVPVPIALYRRLLQARLPCQPLRGVLEHFAPAFHRQELGAQELDAVYEARIAPVLQQLVEGGRATPVPARSAQRSARAAVTDQSASAAATEQNARAAVAEQSASAAVAEQSARAAVTEQSASAAVTEQNASAAVTEQSARAAVTEQSARAAVTEQNASAAATEQNASSAAATEQNASAAVPRISETRATAPAVTDSYSALGETDAQRFPASANGHTSAVLADPGAEVPDAVELSDQGFLNHMVVLGGAGSGKTDLALNLVEQVLESRVPVLLLDRYGDMVRYADPAAWGLADEPDRVARRKALFNSLDIQLFTPGYGPGRPLRWPVVPRLTALSPDERRAAIGRAATALSDLMGLQAQGVPADQLLRTLVGRVLAAVCPVEGPLFLEDLQAHLKRPNEALRARCGALAGQLPVLTPKLERFVQEFRGWWSENGGPLDGEQLLGLRSNDTEQRVRLTILSMGFLADETATLTWTESVLQELNRVCATQRADGLRALLLLDGADLYLPQGQEARTREPLLRLLEQGPAAGIGVLLVARRPGDLDHAACHGRVGTWVVGRVREARALERLRGLALPAGLESSTVFPNQRFGQFHLISGAKAVMFQGDPSLLDPEPLSGQEIAELARRNRVAAP